MNFKQSEHDDLGEDGDYIILNKDLTIFDVDYNDAHFKAGTVFEIIYTDEDDMEGYYVTPLVNGVPGKYVNRDEEYMISLAFQWEQRDKGINNINVVPKRDYELKYSLTPKTQQTFNDLIDEL
jgi:hypothetical protein